jgi:hypothetical protein
MVSNILIQSIQVRSEVLTAVTMKIAASTLMTKAECSTETSANIYIWLNDTPEDSNLQHLHVYFSASLVKYRSINIKCLQSHTIFTY